MQHPHQHQGSCHGREGRTSTTEYIEVRSCLYLCWADGLTKLAGDTPLLTVGVATECMLPSETWADMTLLKRVVDQHLTTTIIPTTPTSSRHAPQALVSIYRSHAAAKALLTFGLAPISKASMKPRKNSVRKRMLVARSRISPKLVLASPRLVDRAQVAGLSRGRTTCRPTRPVDRRRKLRAMMACAMVTYMTYNENRGHKDIEHSVDKVTHNDSDIATSS